LIRFALGKVMIVIVVICRLTILIVKIINAAQDLFIVFLELAKKIQEMIIALVMMIVLALFMVLALLLALKRSALFREASMIVALRMIIALVIKNVLRISAMVLLLRQSAMNIKDSSVVPTRLALIVLALPLKLLVINAQQIMNVMYTAFATRASVLISLALRKIISAAILKLVLRVFTAIVLKVNARRLSSASWLSVQMILTVMTILTLLNAGGVMLLLARFTALILLMSSLIVSLNISLLISVIGRMVALLVLAHHLILALSWSVPLKLTQSLLAGASAKMLRLILARSVSLALCCVIALFFQHGFVLSLPSLFSSLSS